MEVPPRPVDNHFAQHLWPETGEYYKSHHILSVPSSLPSAHSEDWNLAEMQIILSISSSSHIPQPPTRQISHAHLLKWRAVTWAAYHTTYCLSSVTLGEGLTSQIRDGRGKRKREGSIFSWIKNTNVLAAFRFDQHLFWFNWKSSYDSCSNCVE